MDRQMKKYTIITLGCKVNQYESDAIAQSLQASGWSPVRHQGEADLCIINTCTVTQKASMQSRQAVRKAIRSSPRARIVVTGCYAQTEPEIIKNISGVHTIVGHSEKHNIPEIILSENKNNQSALGSCPELIWRDIRKASDFKAIPVAAFGSRTRPFLKIQDGCDAFCTYCVVPFARGRSRSMPMENVLENIKQLKQAGFREVVLTGVHLGCYGFDLSPKTDLSDLLCRIQKSASIERVRLSSIEPHELTEDIISLVRESGIFCHHFHIPLQSGDDNILKKMNRPYTNQLFRNLVLSIRSQIPDAAIGVDILVGFPGETEDAFENTYAIIDELPVSYLHVFPFSARKETPAGRFPGQVPGNIVKARAHRLRKLGNAKRVDFYNNFLGKKVKVLIEGQYKCAEDLLKGTSSNYIPVLTRGVNGLKNTIVDIRLEKLNSSRSVFGTLCTST
jgi:threonylcarbamoyladenosine tRNA methylthiotransferase MtaB